MLVQSLGSRHESRAITGPGVSVRGASNQMYVLIRQHTACYTETNYISCGQLSPCLVSKALMHIERAPLPWWKMPPITVRCMVEVSAAAANPVSGCWCRGATRYCCVQKRVIAHDTNHLRSGLTPPHTRWHYCVASPLNDSYVCLLIPSAACGPCARLLNMLSLLYVPLELLCVLSRLRIFPNRLCGNTAVPPPSYWRPRRETPHGTQGGARCYQQSGQGACVRRS